MTHSIVKDLVWNESSIKPRRGDYHTIGGTGYTVRCVDENGWKWSNSVGGHGYEGSPGEAKTASQVDHNTRTLSTLDLPAYRLEVLEEAARYCETNRITYSTRPGQEYAMEPIPERDQTRKFWNEGHGYALAIRALADKGNG